jgi:hypothetical protein
VAEKRVKTFLETPLLGNKETRKQGKRSTEYQVPGTGKEQKIYLAAQLAAR